MRAKPGIFLMMATLLLGRLPATAQALSLSGRIQDARSGQWLPGVVLLLSDSRDSSRQFHTLSGANGSFRLYGLAPGSYRLQGRLLGYTPLQQALLLTRSVDLGILRLQTRSTTLGAVKVRGQVPTTQVHGDTTEFNAGAFKTNPDATAEDLIKKMPGITVNSSGSVQAQGEDVKKVLVDGKPFFGNDPTLALRNLPSEVIDKVQVFDKLSDQAQFSGFDDGNSQKTLNIVTKANRRKGRFGKFFTGYGTDGHYQLGGDLNIFEQNRRISLIGLSNNINQQNFSFQDLLGVLGGGGKGGFRGPGGAGDFLIGQRGGTNTTNSLGANYSGNWGKKITVTGSYFFNNTNNLTSQSLNRTYFLNGDSSQLYRESDLSGSHNYNHRFNLRMVYAIDSQNSLIVTPDLGFQTYSSSTSLQGAYLQTDSSLLSQTSSSSSSSSHGYNLGGDVLYRHAFSRKGRTLSMDLHSEWTRNDGISSQYSRNLFFKGASRSDTLDQQAAKPSHGRQLSGRMVYTEPLGSSAQLEAHLEHAESLSFLDKRSYSYDPATQNYQNLDSTLSNSYQSAYTTNNAGLSVRMRKQEDFLVLGLSYQGSTLKGSQQFPYSSSLTRGFGKLLPHAMLRLRFSPTSNLRLFYRTATSAPSIGSLQNVIDNSNPLQLSSGNPDLQQQYTHTLIARYGAVNVAKSHTFFGLLFLQATRHYVADGTYTSRQDSVLAPGILLKPGSQLSKPLNLNGYFSGRGFLSYGFPLKPIKSNLNLNASVDLSRVPGEIDHVRNVSDTYAEGLSAVLASNISENVDFTLSYSGTYTILRNTIQPQLNSNYYSSTSSARVNLIFWKGLVFATDLDYETYSGLGAQYDQHYLLWNLSLAKKVLHNQRGEIRASVYDVLNQNQSVSRSSTAAYVQDKISNVLHQYAMLSFTYTLRSFGPAQNRGKHPWMMQVGRPPMGPPPGIFFRPGSHF